MIQSGGDTTLKGAQVKGRGVALSAENLNIESVQDSAAYNDRRFQGSAQITVGYGFSGSAGYSQSKTNADHRSISEQSGIYAGDGGFQVNIKGHTDLKGGIITATEAAEQNGRNRFQTATLSRSDIENHSRYQGGSFGIGMSGNADGGRDGRQQDGLNKGIGFGRDGGSRNSTTRSGIGTRNITIGNDPDGTQAKAAYTDTRTETAEANTGRLNNMFDKDRVRKELDRQREVTQQFGGSVQQVRTEINRKAEGYRKLAKIAEEEAAARLQNGDTAGWRRAVGSADENRRKAGQWQKGGVALSALASGLAAPADSGSGIAAAALNPAGAYAIGQYFKGLAQENLLGGKTETAELTAAQETARAVAHGVIAAATAAAGGSNALSAAISAGGAEAAAPYVSQWLYGEKDGSKLTAGQKETVSAVLSLGGAAVGAASGNGTDAVEGSRAAQNAVENNYLLKQDWDKYRNTIKSCSQSGNVTACYRNAQKYLYETSKYRNEKLKAACAENGDITLCSKYVMEADLSREVTKKELGSYGTNNPAKPLPAFINYYDIPWSDNPTIHYWATSINLPIANKLNYGFNLAVNRLTGEIFIGVTSSPNINKSNGNTKLLGVPSISATIGHINNLSSIEKAQLWKTISDTIQGQSTTASGCGYFTCFGANKTSSGKVSFELSVTTAKPYSVTVGKENMIRVGRIVRE